MKTEHYPLETLSTMQQGRAILFDEMTAIGPKNTADRDAAAVFASAADANSSPAKWHGLSFYRAVPVEKLDETVQQLLDGWLRKPINSLHASPGDFSGSTDQ